MSQQQHFLSIEQLRESDRYILFYSSQLLVRGELVLWRHQQVSAHLSESADYILLQTDAEGSVIAVRLQQDISAQLQAELSTLRSLLHIPDQQAFLLAGRASQLVNWYQGHRYCGSCGSRTVHHHTERTLVCEACSQHFFPRISPCVIMLVTRGEQMLLARSSRHNSNFYSCLAGFIEIGETPEQAVSREVMEEVSLGIKNIRYVSSQSWPFPSQLMLGYLAEYDGGEIVPEPAEIAEAHWYDIDALPNVPSSKISVAGRLIDTFVAEVQSSRAR